jgi:hypothetical protein
MADRVIKRDTLVTIINNRNDLAIALQKNWYRIPVKTKRTPISVKKINLNILRFTRQVCLERMHSK